MLRRTGLLMLLVLAASALDKDEYEPPIRRTRFLPSSPLARCLSSAPQAGCSVFACLEHSSCETEGMHDLCNSFLSSSAVFNTEGRTFVKESIKCIANGITSKVRQTISHCDTFQNILTDVQKECYSKLGVCGMARSNSDSIGEVVKVPSHFPNRYYSTLLQSLMECDEDTVEVVRSGLVARLSPDMETLFQLLQKKSCPVDSDPGHAGTEGQDNFRWPLGPPVFQIQSSSNKDPNHFFISKRSAENETPNQ